MNRPFTISSFSLVFLGAFSLLPASCSPNSGGDDGAGPASVPAVGGPGGKADGVAPSIPEGATSVLEIYPMDIWAKLLPTQDVQLEVTCDGMPCNTTGSPIRYVPLSQAGDVRVRLSAPDHEPVEVTVLYDGTTRQDGAMLQSNSLGPRAGVSMSHEPLDYGGRVLPTHSLYLGLRHLWFSSQGRPARRGNQVDLLTDGEQAWKSVYVDLEHASQSVLLATWWWESDFELIRDEETHAILDPEVRWGNTILGLLERSPAHKRVLVGQFWGQDSVLSWLTSDNALRAYAETPDDGFEFMGMANETSGKFYFEPTPFSFGDRVRSSQTETSSRLFDTEQTIPSNVDGRVVDLTEWPSGIEVEHASYHQKFMVIDDTLAYVGGMNLRRGDWDTSEHRVFDHRRMLFDASLAERQAVLAEQELPDMGPRKDYMLRLKGPAAQDAADVFKLRWDHQLERGVEYAEQSTPFDVKRDISPVSGGAQVQVTATMPEPFSENAIAESWVNAIRQASSYLFIEDQYFRMPMINEIIAERMDEVKELRLVVITKPVDTWTDLGCEWTTKSHELFASRFPSRYMMLQLRSFAAVANAAGKRLEGTFADMDVHSKMLIVDDTFLSVGSCNKNNRGLVFEGELNVAVVDRSWVADARRRILQNLLGPDTTASDDPDSWWVQLQQASERNDETYARWQATGFELDATDTNLPAEYLPHGFLYSLDFPPPADCFVEDVGPDMFSL